MAFLGKLYKYDKDENFDAFLNTLGVSAEPIAGYVNLKAEHKLEKNGDTYTLSTVLPNESKVLNFKIGEEFEEKVARGTLVAKTTFTIDDNILTEVQKFEDGNVLTIKREYFDDKLIVTLTRTNWDGTARRFYTV